MVDQPFIPRDKYIGRAGDRVATETGPCCHDGCTLVGFDLTEDLCSMHFVTDVLANLEDLLHEANTNWSGALTAEADAKLIWRCICGFSSSFSARESHFLAHNGDADHGPPAGRTLVALSPSAKTARRRITTSESTDLSKVEEIG